MGSRSQPNHSMDQGIGLRPLQQPLEAYGDNRNSHSTPGRSGQHPSSTTSRALHTPPSTASHSRNRSTTHSEQNFTFDDEPGPVTRKPSFLDEPKTPLSTRRDPVDFDAECVDTIIDERAEYQVLGKEPILVFHEMSAHTWDNRPVLENVSGYLCAGQIMGVIGLYGSGKSTFLHGLIATSGDEIGRGGRGYQSQTFAVPNLRVGYVGHDSTLLEHLKVQEIIRFALLLDCPELDNERVEARMNRWISKLDLVNVLDQPMKILSTGQRRRVDLVLVLVRACNLMIMDEPLTGLDSYTGVEIMREIRQIVDAEKISVIVSLSQLKPEVFNCLDLALVLHDGKTAYFGPASDTMIGLLELGGASYFDARQRGRSTSEEVPDLQMLMGHESSPNGAAPPAHKLHDFLSAHRQHMIEAKESAEEVVSISQRFEESVANHQLVETIKHMIANPDSQLEPYTISDSMEMTKGLFWRRVRYGTMRFCTDMFRDRAAWLSLLLAPLFMLAVVSAVFYNMGSDITIDFPMVQGAFFFTIASMLILQVQLTIPRCCRLYRLFRQAHIDGTQSAWQFAAEAVFCTFGFALLYGILTLVASSFWLNELGDVHGTSLGSAIILAISSQIIAWCSVFATNGNVVFTVMAYTFTQLVFLGCDGFVIPFAHIRSPFVLLYYINPRAWFMQASMVDLICGEGPCESSPFSSDVLFSPEVGSLREKLVYSQGSEVASYDEVNQYLQSLIIDYFDLDTYSSTLSIGYSIIVAVAAGVVAIRLLFASLWLFRQAHKAVEDRYFKWLTRYNLDLQTATYAIFTLFMFITLLVSSLVADQLQNHNSGSGAKVIRYDPQMNQVCAECMGIPKLTDLLSNTGGIYDTSLFIQRLDITTRALLARIPAVDDLCEEENFFKPTYKSLTVTSLQQLFDDYFPRSFANFVRDRDDFINLVHAEGRLARWWIDIAAADVLQRVTSFSDPNLQGFPINDSPELQAYFLSTYGVSLADAMAGMQLYVFTRVPGLDDLSADFVSDDHLQLNPYALFYRNSSDSDVHTVAIQLGRSGLYQIMTPSAGYGWAAAKAFVRHGMFLRGVIEHFVHCHHLLASVGVAAENALPIDHPLREVLFIATEPQLYAQVVGTIVQALVPVLDMTAQQQLELVSAFEEQFEFYRDIPYEYHQTQRGIWDVNDGLNLPLRPLLHEYWTEVIQYSQNVVDYMYDSDQELLNDKELKRWKEMIQSSKGGNVPGLFDPSDSCELCTKQDFVDLLSSLIFAALRHSTSLIVELSSEAMYYPFMASNLRASRIPATVTDYSEAEFLAMFSDSAGILDHMTFFNIGLTLVQRRLDRWPERFEDQYLKGLAQDFVNKIVAIAENHGNALDLNIAPRIEGFPQW